MACALLRDFTLKNMIIRAVLVAQMNLTLSHTTMSVSLCTTYLLLSGDMLQHCFENPGNFGDCMKEGFAL